jgi:hypothetical protein
MKYESNGKMLTMAVSSLCFKVTHISENKNIAQEKFKASQQAVTSRR